jgi:hypothetical protein
VGGERYTLVFDFFRKSGLRSPSAALRQALVASNLPAGCDAAKLGVAESRGRYAGRSVTYIRVFDPDSAARRSVNVLSRYAYQDLNAHLDLVLRAGFVEKDGTVVLNTEPPDAQAKAGSRAAADRGVHADDEQVVFPHAGS